MEGQSSSSLPSLQSCWPSHRWTNQRRLLGSRDQSPPITAHLVPAEALAAVCAAELLGPAIHPQPRTHRVRLGRGNIRFQWPSSNIVETFANSVDSSSDLTSSEPSGQSWSPSQSQAEWMQKCRSRHWNSARPQLRGVDTGRGVEEEESGDDDDDSDDGGGDDSSSSSSSSATGGQSSSSSPSGQSAKQTCKQCMMMFINQGTYRGLHRTPKRWRRTAWTWRTASARPRHT